MEHDTVAAASDRAVAGRAGSAGRHRAGERRLFITGATLFCAIVVVGFARTYYLKILYGTPPLPSLLVHMHGLVMSLWVVLFATQVSLIRTKRVALHKRLGYAGVGLAILVVIVGFFTAISAAKNGSASFPPNIPALAFLAMPMFDLVMMVVLFGGAIYYRRRSENHRRLMLLTAINLLPPALARFPMPALTGLGPLFFFGAPMLLTLAALGYDRWHTGRFNRVFVVGALLLIASYPLRLILAGTDVWMRFAAWLTTFALV